MRRARALLPYAVVAVGVVLASAIAISPAVLEAAPNSSPRSLPRAELSENGRMTYWKHVSDTQSELWVSDLDGRRAWPLLREPATLSITSTRWSPDGETVGYIRGNTSLVLAGIDGTGWVFRIPYALLKEDLRIAGYSVSPAGTSLAVTLQKLGGARPRLSDVYVLEVSEQRRLPVPPDDAPEPRLGNPPWTRVTELGDAHAGRWISGSELFIETTGGMLARLNVETKELWPITGMRVASPLIGENGRLYVAGGGWVHTDAAGGPWANGGIWSVKLDGSGARREIDLELQSVRLIGRLADGRFVLAAPGSTYIVGEKLMPTPWRAGTIRRVAVSADGTQVIGFTDTRVVRMAPSKIPDTGDLNPPPDAVVTLLDGVRDADVWFPQPAIGSLPVPSKPGGPPARLAFVVGSTLWEASQTGSVRALTTAPPGGWLGQFAWSPSGDRLAVVVGEPQEQPNSYVVVLGRPGELWRSAKYIAPHVSWSSDGSRIAVSYAEPAGQREQRRVTAILDASGGGIVEKRDGLELQFTSRGLLGLDQGVLDRSVEWQQYTNNALYAIDQNGRRLITDARTLSDDPALRDVAGRGLPPWISGMVPSPDGQLIGLWLYRIRQGGYSEGASVVIDAAGKPLWVDPFEPRTGVRDLVWSPSGAHLAMTVAWGPTVPGTEQGQSTARVVDPRTRRVVLERPGDFAGWSPDGSWIYVALPEGLFAYPLDGREGVRVGPYGVDVRATRP